MKYIISTLGCKVNQYETQAMEALLQQHGHSPAKDGEQADAVIVNTCAVTAESGRKSRQTIRRLKEENPEAVLAVCGCYSQISQEEVAALGAQVIFGAAERKKLVEAVEEAVEKGLGCRCVDKPFQRRDFERLPSGAVAGRTRAMLKIQDGCVNFCSYCIIPYTRGRLRSLPIPEAVEETRRLAGLGYRELVLTGIEVASYGLDLPGRPGLTDLVCAVAEAAGDMRIRLSSLEPTVVTEDFCRRLAAAKRLCRHFHLSLQSGCDRTLKAMNRKYDTAGFYRAVELLREHFPGCALTCDLIVGFPGETEQDHRETLDFIRKCAFESMHIFPYSRRPGTPADSMPGQLENAVKARRAHEAQQIARQMHLDFLRSCIGSRLSVLFETQQDGLWTGHSDSYVLVSAQGEALRGQIRQVLVSEVRGEQLFGHLDD
ncbi:MAG TPA: tRNA (N(6)-L-threonylcarbamoyladenosine(37)-C(2))-methylthiotransferase MtaB [Candidatus Limivicinus faecipullorum]|nr:tRNA (N(6)-L-threonylcarbamoyladenosine(37)-C(2))-methylthiotransferase MtaB [Candidatus Limivicinus faecipullorum]